MTEQLTIEDFKVLARIDDPLDMIGDVGNAITEKLFMAGYLNLGLGSGEILTDTGRTALAAYKAQRDLVLFVAEFEEWLEAKYTKSCRTISEQGILAGEVDEIEFGVWETIIRKYRVCKERIENVE